MPVSRVRIIELWKPVFTSKIEERGLLRRSFKKTRRQTIISPKTHRLVRWRINGKKRIIAIRQSRFNKNTPETVVQSSQEIALTAPTKPIGKRGPWTPWEFLSAGLLMGILGAVIGPLYVIGFSSEYNPVDPMRGVVIGFLVPMVIGLVGFILRFKPKTRRFTKW